jgi:ABC-type Mn2+/Zn2+ transport system ATPase subunit
MHVPSVLTVDNLNVYYDCCSVIENLSFSVPRGSLCGISGPNGSGKSTLIKVLAGLHRQFCGCLSWNFLCASKKIAYLPQFSDVNRNFPLTVFQVAAMGMGKPFFSSKKDLIAVYQALESVDMLTMKDVSLYQLSGGQLQRTLLARLLVQDGAVMLLDEPFVGLDAQTVILLWNVIKQWSTVGKTVFLVHHQDDILVHCSQVIDLQNHSCGQRKS